MEVAGLLIGIPGVIGPLLKIGIQGYEVFTNLRNYDEDFASCQHDFEVERQRLINWAKDLQDKAGNDRQGLMDLLKSDTQLNQLTKNILYRIAKVFTQVHNFGQKHQVSESAVRLGSTSPTMTSGIMGKYSRRSIPSNTTDEPRIGSANSTSVSAAFVSMSLGMDPGSEAVQPIFGSYDLLGIEKDATAFRKELSQKARLKWTFFDKSKLEKLVVDLHKYNDQLIVCKDGLATLQSEHLACTSGAPTSKFSKFNVQKRLPFRKNTKFCGRKELLGLMHQKLAKNTPSRQSLVVLRGMGGIGKTQMALQYAHTNSKSFSSIWWIDAKSQTTVHMSARKAVEHLALHYAKGLCGSMTDIAIELGIPGALSPSGSIESKFTDEQRLCEVFCDWLAIEGNSDWLLIIDNNDNTEAVKVRDLLPTCDWGRVIITTRRKELEAMGFAIPVDEVDEEEGVNLLATGMGKIVDDLSFSERNRAKDLVQKLGRLPLALSQAAAYMQKMGVSYESYSQQYDHNFNRIATKGTTDLRDTSIASCWEISFRQLSKLASNLLQMFAFLSNTDINMALFTLGRKNEIEWLSDRDSVEDAIEELVEFSLIRRKHDMSFSGSAAHALINEASYAMHPIIHKWSRDRNVTSIQSAYVANAVSLVCATIATEKNQDASQYWKLKSWLDTHVKSIADYYNTQEVTDVEAAKNLISIAWALSEGRDFQTAQDLAQKSLACLENSGDLC